MHNAPHPSDGEKPHSLLEIVMNHNTTIIAVIIGISTIISSYFQDKLYKAEQDQGFNETEWIVNHADFKEKKDKLEEYINDETAEANPEKYASLVKEFEKYVYEDSLESNKLMEANKNLKEITEKANQKKEEFDYLEAAFDFSILVSSIGMSRKKKIYGYIALSITIVGVLFAIAMFF